MKLRIAGIVAVVCLVGAISAYRWDNREDAPGGEVPTVARSPQADAKQSELKAAKVDSFPSPTLEVSSDAPKPAAPPIAVAPTFPQPGNAPAPPVPSATKPPAPPPAGSVSGPSVSGTPPSPPQPDLIAKAAIELDQVGLMFRDYRTRMGENPVGPNADIMKAVMGENPKKARLGPPEGQQLNANGELVDRWGTPYFFHQMARTEMEIRSAGPDRKMWTDDDIVGR